MIPSILKIWSLFLCCGFLTSCVGASNWLSGPIPFQKTPFHPSNRLTPIQIEETTKQEVFTNLGNPSDRQKHSIDGIQIESLSYITTETAVNPYQYIPFFGAIAYWGDLAAQPPSAAISFSSEDVVSGMTVATVNAYGDVPHSEINPIANTPPSFYGMRNPDVSHSPTASTDKGP